MKFYIIQSEEYNFNNYIYIKSEKDNFIEALNTIEDNSVVFTNLFKDDNELMWFNNKHQYDKKNKINNLIIKKKIILFKLIQKSVNDYHFLEFMKDLLSNSFQISNMNSKRLDLNNVFGKIKNCIIVANGNKLCKDPNMIDSKDFVVRMNSARIKGFEDKVGSKTDLYFRGKSRGAPDFEEIYNQNLINLTSQKLFYYPQSYWERQPYIVKLNWNQLFREQKYNFIREPNFFMKSRYSKKYKLNTSGQYILLFMLYNSIVYGFKVFTTGYDLHSKWKEFCEKNPEAMKHCASDGHYYGEDKDNYNTEPQNMVSFYNYHHIEDTRYIYQLLLENEIFFEEN